MSSYHFSFLSPNTTEKVTTFMISILLFSPCQEIPVWLHRSGTLADSTVTKLRIGNKSNLAHGNIYIWNTYIFMFSPSSFLVSNIEMTNCISCSVYIPPVVPTSGNATISYLVAWVWNLSVFTEISSNPPHIQSLKEFLHCFLNSVEVSDGGYNLLLDLPCTPLSSSRWVCSKS